MCRQNSNDYHNRSRKCCFWQNPACFHNRKPRENRNGGNMYNAIKGTDDKPITTIILTEKKKL